MSTPFFAHHEIQYPVHPADQKESSPESLLHKIWITFLFVVFLMVLFVFL